MAKKTRDEFQTHPLGGGEDEDLSALLDGELSPERAEQLRRRLAEEPELAARCAELGEVSGQLRNLAHPADRSESESQLEVDRVEAMHGALRQRISAEQATMGIETPAGTSSRRSARVIPLHASWKGLAPAVAALAAGLALYLSLGDFRSDDSAPTGNLAASDLSEGVTPDPEIPLERPRPTADAEAGAGLSAGNGLAERDAPGSAPQVIAEASPAGPLEMAREEQDRRVADRTVDLAIIGDEELAIAFEFDVLADFDVIENLELLELLDELDSLERI